MATFNSRLVRLLLTATLCCFALADFASAQTNLFAARAEAEFHRAQKQFESNTNDATAAWQLGRACFDFADFAEDKDQRADIARQGIAVCRQALALDSNSAAAHYYLGMNLGQLARTETLGALKLVREMEREFKTTAQLDSHFDFAGPERNLGLLYRDAPGWPTSIGSRKKARQWLERAAQLAPDFPENRLNLIEAFLQWDDPTDADREMKLLNVLWPQAQKKFSGEKWERDWDDWTTRRNTARQKLEDISSPAKPPRDAR